MFHFEQRAEGNYLFISNFIQSWRLYLIFTFEFILLYLFTCRLNCWLLLYAPLENFSHLRTRHRKPTYNWMIDVYKQYSSHVMATERLKIKKRICLPRSWCLSCEGSLTCYGDNRLLFGFQCNLRRPMVFTIIRKPLVMELSLTVLMILRFVATGIQILDLLHAQRVL